MSVAECPSDPAQLPAYVRAQGAIRARFDAQGGATRIAELYEAREFGKAMREMNGAGIWRVQAGRSPGMEASWLASFRARSRFFS